MNQAGIQAYFHRVHLSILLKKIYLPTKDYILFELNQYELLTKPSVQQTNQRIHYACQSVKFSSKVVSNMLPTN